MRYKLTISYDGTNYFGWQVQGAQDTIQKRVQHALETILRHKIDLTGSGRTDSGVHARGQTAHFDTPLEINPFKLCYSLNALLPLDIRILNVEPTPSHFHARYSAEGKIYHYHLHLDPVGNPFTDRFRLQVFKKIDLQKMGKGALQLLGTHDFTSFTNEPQKGSVTRDPIRTLKRLDIVEQEGGVRLEFEADGFLYKMVRNLTGALIEVGAGRITPDQIKQILTAKDRRQGPPTVPPQGLFLMKVIYKSICSKEG